MSTVQKKGDFKRTDDEAELLNVTLDYRVKKMLENVDWESVKAKYDDIRVLTLKELLATVEEAKDNWLKDYPHTKDEVTKKY